MKEVIGVLSRFFNIKEESLTLIEKYFEKSGFKKISLNGGYLHFVKSLDELKDYPRVHIKIKIVDGVLLVASHKDIEQHGKSITRNKELLEIDIRLRKEIPNLFDEKIKMKTENPYKGFRKKKLNKKNKQV